MPNDPKTLTRAELARQHGVDPKTIDAWVARGCPVEGRGRSKRYDSAAVIRWRIEDELERTEPTGRAPGVVTLTEARRQKAEADARAAQLDVAEREGQVVDVELAAAELEHVLATVRLRFEALPAQIAPRMAPLKTTKQRRRFLEDAVREVLEELSDGGALVEAAVARA